MVQPCRTGWWRRTGKAFPCVQRDVMMVSTRRKKHRAISVPLRHLKTKHTGVEPERPFKVCNFQMNMSNAHLWVSAIGRSCKFAVLWRNHSSPLPGKSIVVYRLGGES